MLRTLDLGMEERRRELHFVSDIDPRHLLHVDLRKVDARIVGRQHFAWKLSTSNLHDIPLRRDDSVFDHVVCAVAVERWVASGVQAAAEQEAAHPDAAALSVDVGESRRGQHLLNGLPLGPGAEKYLQFQKAWARHLYVHLRSWK